MFTINIGENAFAKILKKSGIENKLFLLFLY